MYVSDTVKDIIRKQAIAYTESRVARAYYDMGEYNKAANWQTASAATYKEIQNLKRRHEILNKEISKVSIECRFNRG
jgi:hypothetical protein